MKQRAGRLLPLVLLGVLLWLIRCGGGGGSGPDATPPDDSGSNVQSIVVNGGPTADPVYGSSYANIAYTSVTICVPGTTNCQTIDGVLVDTGSTGLRLLSSAVTLSLPAQTVNGNQLAEYVQFVDGSYVWGPVRIADVKLSGETAGSVPVHILGHDEYPVPADLASSGTEADDLESLGANGVLGVGQYQQDCGDACADSSDTGSTAYYQCTSSGSSPVIVSLSKQVQNPVALFPVDNNGVIIRMPAVSGSKTSVTGSMIFGIGTQSNNGLGSAVVLTLNSNSYITTTYKGRSMPYSFIDSGSNAYFFPDSSIAQCGSYYAGFYCPGTSLSLSAVNLGGNGLSKSVSFTVEGAQGLFAINALYNVFSTLAGPNNAYGNGEFDWGLPFFYGRSVYTAIDGKSTPAGNGPYWAY